MIDANPPALRQMIDVFDEVDGPVLAIEEVPKENVSAYGIIDADEVRPGVYRIRDLVEKPPLDQAPSNLAIIGRYILTPDIFPALEETAKEKDRTGEIQLTNGLRRLLKKRPIYGCRINGVRHDTGNKLGFLKAVVYFALRRPDLADAVPRVPARPRARRAEATPAELFSSLESGLVRTSAAPLVSRTAPAVEASRRVRLSGSRGARPSTELVVLVRRGRRAGGGRAAVALLRLAGTCRPPTSRCSTSSGAGLGRGLLGVVGDVEPRPLELDRGGGEAVS